MFNTEKLQPIYKTLLGFRQHFDTSDIEIDESLTVSDTGEFYQDKHPALRLDYINATLPSNQLLDDYLSNKIEIAINEIFNDVIQYRQMAQYGKTLLEQTTLLNRKTWSNDKIVNQKRFVFLQIKVLDTTGLAAVINEIGLQLDGPQELTLHLFHSSKEDAIATFQIETVNTSAAWKRVEQQLDSMSTENFAGGVFILGYYQSDLTTQAINYSNFNWDVGECAGCGGATQYVDAWKSIGKNFFIYPGYIAAGNYEIGKLPNLGNAFWTPNLSWGLNLRMSTRCDLTEFFIANRFMFKNLLALKVANIILKDMRFSTETNFVNDEMRNMVIREVEGDKETNYLNISQQYSRELKAVNFNMEGINKKCLGCAEDAFAPSYGVI